MHDAWRERDLPQERSEPDTIDRIAESYLSDADGDARRALRRAVEDGVEAAGLVSRGFARWGRSFRQEAT